MKQDKEKKSFIKLLVIAGVCAVIVVLTIFIGKKDIIKTPDSEEPLNINGGLLVTQAEVQGDNTVTMEKPIATSEESKDITSMMVDLNAVGGFDNTVSVEEAIRSSWGGNEVPSKGVQTCINADGTTTWWVTGTFNVPLTAWNPYVVFTFTSKQVVPRYSVIYYYDSSIHDVSMFTQATYCNDMKDGYLLFNPIKLKEGMWYIAMAFDTEANALGETNLTIYESESAFRDWATGYIEKGKEENQVLDDDNREEQERVDKEIEEGATISYDTNEDVDSSLEVEESTATTAADDSNTNEEAEITGDVVEEHSVDLSNPAAEN